MPNWYRNLSKYAQTKGDRRIFDEVSRAIDDAIRFTTQPLHMLSSFKVTIFGEPVAVYNETKIPALGMAVDHAVAKHMVSEEKRRDDVPPASTAVCMSSSLKGAAKSFMYRSVLFHELVHAAQILRARMRTDVDFDSMTDADVVKGVANGSLPRAMSTFADPDQGSLHVEFHVMMMQNADRAISTWKRMVLNGSDMARAENAVVSAMKRSLAEEMKLYRKVGTKTLTEDSRWWSVLKPAMDAHGISRDSIPEKEKYRIPDREFDMLLDRYITRCESLIRDSVRALSQTRRK